MGFTFHKLYPMIYPTAIDCCDFTAAELREICRVEWIEGVDCWTGPRTCYFVTCTCKCPTQLEVSHDCGQRVGPGQPCTDECIAYRCTTWSTGDGEGRDSGTVRLCWVYDPNADCESRCRCWSDCLDTDSWCVASDWECCPRRRQDGTCEAVGWGWIFGSLGYPGDVSSISNFSNCVIEGAGPKTYRVENVGINSIDGFNCFTPDVTSTSYIPVVLEGQTSPHPDGYVYGDPAFPPSDPTVRRIYKDLNGVTYSGGVTGPSAGYNTYCFKLHSTPSQAEGIENRVMFIAGRNIYRYTGPLSGDPQLSSYGAASDPFWNSGGMTGVTGIKQWEESISGRTFPLPDTVMVLPLWGQTANNNLGINFGSGAEDCENPYWDFTRQGDTSGSLICGGCRCIGNRTSEATGHHLSIEHFGSSSGRGYTAGYFSFASFNPHCYLDHIWNQSLVDPERGSQAIMPLHDQFNLLSGLLGNGNFSDLGVSGATCHGERLGVPACSLWSLMKALYSRVLFAIQKNVFVNGFGTTPYGETTFRNSTSPNGFKPFVDALDAMLADDPSQLVEGGTSKVQYHLARVSNQLEICSKRFFGEYNGGIQFNEDRFRFTFPNVFLWDRSAYIAASAADKWKHLYVVGNGNIIHDSGSVAIERPYDLPWDDIVEGPTGLSADILNQNYKSSIFHLNRFNHQLGPIIGEGTTSHHARMLVFNGSGGPTGVGEFTRRNAKSEISLTYMPICDSILLPDTQVLTPCSLCNAHPNQACTPELESGGTCDVINVFPPSNGIGAAGYIEAVMCLDNGGYVDEFNSLTASYQI